MASSYVKQYLLTYDVLTFMSLCCLCRFFLLSSNS